MADGFIAPFKVYIGEVASGTGAAAISGLPFTPDWCIWSTDDEANDNTKSWAASGTTAGLLTLTGRSTTTATTISYLAADL